MVVMELYEVEWNDMPCEFSSSLFLFWTEKAHVTCMFWNLPFFAQMMHAAAAGCQCNTTFSFFHIYLPEH
jgi:hypothetical protein